MLRHLYDVNYSDYRQSININAEKAVAERQRQEQVRRAYELLDLKGRMLVVPNDPKGPVIKYVPGETKFKSGSILTMRSSEDKD